MDYLTREQIQTLHDLKSDRNARRVLQDMGKYLNTFNEGRRKIYYLNKEGRERVGCSKPRSKLTTSEHYLMRNDLYIHLGRPFKWRNEIKWIFGEGTKREITVIPDAVFERNRTINIVEIDHTQKMKKNRRKVEKYRQLIQYNAFKGMPRLIWVTTTEYRRKAIRELCEGLDVDVYLHHEIK